MNPFALMVGAGASLGLWMLSRQSPPRETLNWLWMGLLSLVGSLLGSRFIFVLYHLGYYRSAPLEMVQWSKGGLSWEGAVLGAALVWGIVSAAKHQSPSHTADMLSVLVIPVAAAAWVGCWSASCAYGLPAEWGLPVLDETGRLIKRIPLQPLAALTLLGYNALIDLRLPAQAVPGQRAALTWSGLALTIFLFSFLRGDPVPILAGWRVDSWTAAGFLLATLPFCAAVFRPRQIKNNLIVNPEDSYESDHRSGSN